MDGFFFFICTVFVSVRNHRLSWKVESLQKLYGHSVLSLRKEILVGKKVSGMFCLAAYLGYLKEQKWNFQETNNVCIYEIVDFTEDIELG